ncbi:MAG: peptide chain release factor 1 [Firmicutes bacterium]|nr:peptide chain release factor 1 [Bacillota bacterium]
MFEKLKSIEEKFNKLTDQIADPKIISNQSEWQKLVKEHSSLQQIVDKFLQLKKCIKDIDDASSMKETESDKDMLAMLEEELESAKELKPKLESELKILLLPKDPNDDKNVIIEIRAGAGGDEAGLFGAELMRMYKRFAERGGLAIEDIELNITELGGVKEVVFMLQGVGAFARLKYESGVHRVQRIPQTESQGRIHTSTVTVAVLPEVEDVEVDIKDNDLKIDTFRAGGAGGQAVNKLESAVRITHIPTGLVVQCQDERSQLRNKDKALKILKARLYDHFKQQEDAKYAQHRKSQVGTGDRSERIRTYNYPQGRITDHRIGFTAYNLPEFLDGDIGALIDALTTADNLAKLSAEQ